MLGKTVTVCAVKSSARDAATGLIQGVVQGYRQKGGSPQDAYVYGVKSPIRRFTGTVIASLTRENGQSCWIVAPRRCRACEPELRAALPESLRALPMACHYEKSCGAVLYTVKDGVRHYLLVRNRSGYYGFPKGHTEGVETEHETALREIEEESGITQVEFDPQFREVNRYICRPHVKKEVVLFLARFDENAPIRPAFEIREYALEPYSQAWRTIGHRNDKAILNAAETYLSGAEASPIGDT